MTLYLDDRLIAQDADAAALEAALARFNLLGHKRLRLCAEPKRALTLSRWDGSLFAEVETPTRVDGSALNDWGEACAAARDYLAGRAVRVGWDPGPAFVDVVLGDAYHPDCPLCRKAAGR